MQLIYSLVCIGGILMTTGAQPEYVMHPLKPGEAQVGGEIGRRIEVTIKNNLLKADLDRDFLEPFRQRNAKSGYIGLGKTVEALARFAAYSSDPAVIAKRDAVVAEIIALQEPDGYIGFFEKDARLFSLWDIHEMAYLILGLMADYELSGNSQALDAARKAADYIVRGWQAEPERIPGNEEIMTYMGVTGIEPALLKLYGITGEARYLEFCRDFRELGAWDGLIVKGRWGKIQGHVYAYLSRCMAQLMLYDIQPDQNLWTNTRKALDFMLKEEGLTVIGACGQHECWHDTQDGAGNLGETCATAYAIRWWADLLAREGDARYGDLMERALYNALFAAQSPDGRQIRYYVPFEGPRVYFDKDTYCCPCNYRRIIAELPQMVYYTMADGIAVNLYAPSEATLTLDSGMRVQVTQETRYPQDGRVLLKVAPEKETSFTLRLRLPRWSEKPEVTINGVPQAVEQAPGTFLAIERAWKPEDRVEIHFPMAPRLVKGHAAQSGRAAVLCGPVVFTLNRAQNPQLKEEEDLRLITIDPATLEGPIEDDSVHPGGLACTIKAWRTTSWYPFTAHDFELKLTEFADPGGEMIYFHLPNPEAPELVEDVW